MIISEGTKVGLFSSIMMKPPNIANVYPLRSEKDKTLLNLQPSTKKGPVIIFNTETLDPKSLLYAFFDNHHLDSMLNQLKNLK